MATMSNSVATISEGQLQTILTYLRAFMVGAFLLGSWVAKITLDTVNLQKEVNELSLALKEKQEYFIDLTATTKVLTSEVARLREDIKELKEALLNESKNRN